MCGDISMFKRHYHNIYEFTLYTLNGQTKSTDVIECKFSSR